MTNSLRNDTGRPAVRQSFLLALILTGLLSVAAAIAISSPGSAHAAGIAAQALPRIEATDCSAFKGLDLSGATVQCGYLLVLENRQNPQSRTIKVAYAVIKAHGSNPQPDPVVYLRGCMVRHGSLRPGVSPPA
jgi:hypothetical protein